MIRDGARVAVVGGAGFLGSHLVNHLVDDRKCSVLVLDNLCVGQRGWVHPRAQFHLADITGSEDHLRKVLIDFKNGAFEHRGETVWPADGKPLYVFNYAAFPYVPDSFVRPLHVANVNFFGAMKVINAAQEAGAERILQVSSAELYGSGYLSRDLDPQEKAPCIGLREDAVVSPHSTYGASKAAVDYYCQAAWRERGTPVIALRQFNCVGERETHPYVVPEIISQLSKRLDEYNQGLTLGVPHPPFTTTIKLGNNSFRDFMYAGDAVRIAVELLEHGQPGEVYNLGSETGIKVYDLAKLIGKLMGFAEVQVEQDPSRVRPWEIWHLQSDNSKLRDVVKLPDEMHREVTLEDALRRTVAWFESCGRKWPWER